MKGFFLRLTAGLLLRLVALTPVHAQEAEDTVLTIYFGSNISDLDAVQSKNIRNFLSTVNTISSLTGYADTVGSTKFNLLLSKRRAFAAYRLLQSLGGVMSNDPDFRGENFQQSPELYMNRKVEILAKKNMTGIGDFNQKDSVIEVLELQNVYFVPDKPIIVQQSLPYVNLLARRLKYYKNERFEIVGHVNYQSKKAGDSVLQDLFKLSGQRAKVIYDILLENGIAADRLSYKGVGNSDPVIKNPQNDDERKRNMRVQVFVFR